MNLVKSISIKEMVNLFEVRDQDEKDINKIITGEETFTIRQKDYFYFEIGNSVEGPFLKIIEKLGR